MLGSQAVADLDISCFVDVTDRSALADQEPAQPYEPDEGIAAYRCRHPDRVARVVMRPTVRVFQRRYVPRDDGSRNRLIQRLENKTLRRDRLWL
jgi:hypothetical protein